MLSISFAIALPSVIAVAFQGCVCGSRPAVGDPLPQPAWDVDRIALFNETVADLVRQAHEAHRFPRETCVTRTVKLARRDKPIKIHTSKPDFFGSIGEIYVSTNNRFAVKIATTSGQAVSQISHEKAFLSVFGDLAGGGVTIHPIDDKMSPACVVRTMVTSFAGDTTLFDFRVRPRIARRATSRTRISERQVAAVAVRGIDILRSLHSLGMIHGDIHSSNFVVANPRNPAVGMRLIDFGRAATFIDLDGRHIRDSEQLPDYAKNQALLSPFELRGSKLSRRDDMYRFSEVLFELFGGARFLSQLDPAFLARRKIEWTISNAKSPLFNAFHLEMTTLRFEERPNYEKWIERFAALAVGHNGEY